MKHRGRVVRCRQVMLWGRLVWLEPVSGRVWCKGCGELVAVEVLASRSNRHLLIGLFRDAAAVPLGCDDGETGPPPPEWGPPDAC